ncbi:hypothetical protein TNCT_673711 [Trichonephila clavata]|uniref:Uncharacterized protein n=1 Tax=Trichonephila clavata TaxID=2740835 RepID=A0A8X6KV43_TRICU|nr:hypothetical protein TNCT_673711 [Trichonephila clavata]
MKVLCAIVIVCLIVAAVNAASCPDDPCPDGQSCVRVMGSNYCVKDAKQVSYCYPKQSPRAIEMSNKSF